MGNEQRNLELMQTLDDSWNALDWEEIKEEALGYVAYSGPFHTDEEKQTMTHSELAGANSAARGEGRGDMLHLSSTTPIRSGGKETMSCLSWRRAEPQFNTTTPL
jgi:hypothetical protein